MRRHGRDEVTIILRGTTLLDVRIHPLICVGSTHISVTGETVRAYLKIYLLWGGCSGRSYFLYMGTAFHHLAALCESIIQAFIPFIAFNDYFLYYTTKKQICQGLFIPDKSVL